MIGCRKEIKMNDIDKIALVIGIVLGLLYRLISICFSIGWYIFSLYFLFNL